MDKFDQSADASFKEQLLNELDALYRTARYLAGDPQLAEDIVHDVIAKALESKHTFRATAAMHPWIFTILRNTIKDHHRRQGRQPQNTGLETLELGSTDSSDVFFVDDYVLSHMLDEHIEQALAQLPEEMRLAVLMADVEGFSYKEIAEILGWPPGTVMSRLHRGRKKLRQYLIAYRRI